MAELFIGCSGFNYPHWRGPFYPEGLPQPRWLAHYSSVFNSVELNVTFYRLLKPSVFDRWREETPERFAFTVKGSRFITHVKRLSEPAEPLERFFEGALRLERKLKGVLWQLPPRFGRDIPRLAHFIELLHNYPVRHILEFRNESWLGEELFALCRSHNIALCMADWPDFIGSLPLTADFVYFRRHGHGGNYADSYSADELAADARRLSDHLATGHGVHIYFNNDAQGHAPANAAELAHLLGRST